MLLDLGLPYRSGATVLQEIKLDPQTRDVPVVIVSAMTETLSPERRALADAVLSKPVSMGGLLTTLHRLTNDRAPDTGPTSGAGAPPQDYDSSIVTRSMASPGCVAPQVTGTDLAQDVHPWSPARRRRASHPGGAWGRR